MKPHDEHRRTMAKAFWSAAFLFRQGAGRPRMPSVIATLTHVIHHSTGIIRDRAAELLKEVVNHDTD